MFYANREIGMSLDLPRRFAIGEVTMEWLGRAV